MSFLRTVKVFACHVKSGNYWVHTNCSLTVNGGISSLISWLDHSCQKVRLRLSKGMLSVENFALTNLENQKNMAPNLRQLLNGREC